MVCGEIGDKFGVAASTACEKVNTVGSDENLFTGHSAQICAMSERGLN